MASHKHSGFSGYMLRARIKPSVPRADGAVALVFDGNMRVLLHPADRGDLVLEAQLRTLPASETLSAEMLNDALVKAGQRPSADADYLALDAENNRLVLQQRVGADVSADEFENGLGRFLDSLTAWRANLGVL